MLIEKSHLEQHILDQEPTLNYLIKTIPETIFRLYIKRERENQFSQPSNITFVQSLSFDQFKRLFDYLKDPDILIRL